MLDIYLTDMFTTVLKNKSDQINKTSRPECEIKIKVYLIENHRVSRLIQYPRL
jgi:predicted HTH domain antitoxin